MTRFAIVALFTLGTASSLAAQSPSRRDADALDARHRAAVARGTLAAIDSSYIDPPRARAVRVAIEGQLRAGAYDGLVKPQRFADSVTADLRRVSHDRHLTLLYSPEPLPSAPPASAASASPPPDDAALRRRGAYRDFGVTRVERLAGNIGLLQLSSFWPVTLAAPAIANAMALLAHTDAMIVDLRANGGGDFGAVSFVASYFVSADSAAPMTGVIDPHDPTPQLVTSLPYVPGDRYLAPVYVLVGPGTVSAGEALAYDLRALKRAAIIGRPSAGAANPGGEARIDDHFQVWISRARAVNPITKGSWEGTGVQPDVAVDPGDALTRAHRMALDALLHATAADPRAQREREAALAALTAPSVPSVAHP